MLSLFALKKSQLRQFLLFFMLCGALLGIQSCSAVIESANEEHATAPSILAPEAAAPLETIKLEPGLDLASQFIRLRVKTPNGSDLNLSEALGNKKLSILALVKPGCIYCESFLATLRGQRFKGKGQIVFILDASHASLEDFKRKASDNAKLGKWFYDYSNKFA